MNSLIWLQSGFLLSYGMHSRAVLIATISRARKFDGATIFGECLSIDHQDRCALRESQQRLQLGGRYLGRYLLGTVLQSKSIGLLKDLVQRIPCDIESLQARAQPLGDANQFQRQRFAVLQTEAHDLVNLLLLFEF